MQIGQMLDNTRTRLGDCRAQRPSERQVLLNLTTQLQSYINELNLSAKPWAVDELLMVVNGGQEDYALPIDSSFGKPLRIRTVFDENPAHIERDIEFWEITDTNFDWNLPRNFGNLYYNLDGSPNTALRMAFYRRSGLDQIYVRVVPIPQTTATYSILYQLGVYGDTAALADVPVLPQHHALIEVRTAISLLPHTEWDDNAAANADKRKELALSLGVDLARLERNFNNYIRTVTVSRAPSYRALPFAID